MSNYYRYFYAWKYTITNEIVSLLKSYLLIDCVFVINVASIKHLWMESWTVTRRQASLVSRFRGPMTSRLLVIIWRHRSWRHTTATSPPRHLHQCPAYFWHRRTWPLTWFRGHGVLRSKRGHRRSQCATVPTVGRRICLVLSNLFGAFTVVTWPAAAKSTARHHTSKLTCGTSPTEKFFPN